jgi:hypothetical protein
LQTLAKTKSTSYVTQQLSNIVPIPNPAGTCQSCAALDDKNTPRTAQKLLPK